MLIKIACGGLTALERAIARPEGVKRLSVTKTQLRQLPGGLGACQDLEVLVLSFNKLDTLSPELGSLRNLRRLSLQGNALRHLPVEMSNLDQLQTLDLRFNKFERIPEAIFGMENLRYLYLSENAIETLDLRLNQLPNLQILHLGQNDLNAGPLWLDIAPLENLQEISLHGAGNMLQVPESWANHPRLERLYVDRTVLLPPNFGMANPRLRVIVGSPDLRNTVAN